MGQHPGAARGGNARGARSQAGRQGSTRIKGSQKHGMWSAATRWVIQQGSWALAECKKLWDDYGSPWEREIAVSVFFVVLLTSIFWVFVGNEKAVYLKSQRDSGRWWTRVKGCVTGANEETRSKHKRKSLKSMPPEWAAQMGTSGALRDYLNRACFAITGLGAWGRPRGTLSASRATSEAATVVGGSGSGKGGQVRSRKAPKREAAPAPPACASKDVPPSGPAKHHKLAPTSPSEAVPGGEEPQERAGEDEQQQHESARGAEPQIDTHAAAVEQTCEAAEEADVPRDPAKGSEEEPPAAETDDRAGAASGAEAGALPDDKEEAPPAVAAAAEALESVASAQSRAAPTDAAAVPESEPTDAPESAAKKSGSDFKKRKKGSGALSIVAPAADEDEVDAEGAPGADKPPAPVVAEADAARQALLAESEALVLSKFNLIGSSSASSTTPAPQSAAASGTSPSPTRQEPEIGVVKEVPAASAGVLAGIASGSDTTKPGLSPPTCTADPGAETPDPAAAGVSVAHMGAKSPCGLAASKEDVPAASNEERRCHCNRVGCEVCSAFSAKDSGKNTAAAKAAKALLQVNVSGSPPDKGMPRFRKRKPRKDLDLSACDPVGYFNGNNGNSNLCFMNAGLQLLLHAIRGLPNDLNRCKEPVALALREWVEAVVECGRTFTPGNTPKYAQNAAHTSPKYTVVGCNAAAGLQPSAKGAAGGSLILNGPPVAGGSAGAAPLRVLRKDKSEKLRMVLSEHFHVIARPFARQAQCDSYEFLEGVLEKLRADVAACTLDKSNQKVMQDLTNFILNNMTQDSLQGPEGDLSYLRHLHQLADLRWQADVLGTYTPPGAATTEVDQEIKDDRNSPVSFVGQMMTSTWDREKSAYTGCEFEPFHVWVLPLEEEGSNRQRGGPDVAGAPVMLEDLLESYCKESQPEGQERLFRTTLIWRLPATLIFCLRRFRFDCGDGVGKGEGGSKLETAVDIPHTLDFSCGSSVPVCHHSRARRQRPAAASTANGHAHHVELAGHYNGNHAVAPVVPSAAAEEMGKHLLSLINGRADANGTHPSAGMHQSVQLDTNGGGGRRSHASSSSSEDLTGEHLAAGGDGNNARRALGNSCVHHTRIASPDGCVWESPAAIECADGGGLYDLTGVCYHLGGSLEAGHYVAAVKGPNDQWWECNDELCSPVDSDSVASGRCLKLPVLSSCCLVSVLLGRRIMMWLRLHASVTASALSARSFLPQI